MFSLLEAYEQSNQTISAFCTARDLKVPTFHYWRRKFRIAQSVQQDFIPIPIPQRTERSTLRLAYPNGVSIHLPTADIALIAQLIRLA
jgi:hypothetical protein